MPLFNEPLWISVDDALEHLRICFRGRRVSELLRMLLVAVHDRRVGAQNKIDSQRHQRGLAICGRNQQWIRRFILAPPDQVDLREFRRTGVVVYDDLLRCFPYPTTEVVPNGVTPAWDLGVATKTRSGPPSQAEQMVRALEELLQQREEVFPSIKAAHKAVMKKLGISSVKRGYSYQTFRKHCRDLLNPRDSNS